MQLRSAQVDVRAQLAAFHARHYSASLMTLVLVGKEPLDELQAWVEASCGGIPDLRAPRPAWPSTPAAAIGAAELPLEARRRSGPVC